MAKIRAKTGNITVEEYVNTVKSFHGYAAPGVIIGGFMVNLAHQHLPDGILLDAISETEVCLPDAVQLLTPCTIGNGWLKVFNFGRFAITLYDKDSGNGIRVYIDTEKLEKWPEIKSWFFKLIPKKEQDAEKLLQQIMEAGAGICSYQKVKVDLAPLSKKHRAKLTVCPRCKESYPAADGAICRGCQGQAPYLK